MYLYRAIDQYGQVIDVLVSEKRDLGATRRFFTRVFEHGPRPAEIITDQAAGYPPILEELTPGAWHHTEPYANNRIEADHGRLKSRLRPMRGLTRLRSARVISAGHAFVQSLRRGHYELGTDETANLRVLAAFDELTLAILPTGINDPAYPSFATMQQHRQHTIGGSRGKPADLRRRLNNGIPHNRLDRVTDIEREIVERLSRRQ